jgi:hypothetical protein
VTYTLAFYTAPLDELVGRLEELGDKGDAEIVAQRAVEFLRELGAPVDSLDHSSIGGDWFRVHFIDDVLGGLIGRDTAAHLLERPLAGTTWSGFPSMGWLTADEVAAAVAALDGATPELDDTDSAEMLELVSDVLQMAAETGQDVVTVYS